MIKNTLIITLLLLVIYLYYQQRKNNTDYQDLQTKYQEVVKVNQTFASFCQQEIGGKDIQEIRTKLNGRTLNEILTENDDYELEVDTLTRTKNELESDLLTQSNSNKSLLKEKEGIIKRLEKEKNQVSKDLTNLHNLSKIQSQKVSDLENEIKKLEVQKPIKFPISTLFEPAKDNTYRNPPRRGRRGGGQRHQQNPQEEISKKEEN